MKLLISFFAIDASKRDILKAKTYLCSAMRAYLLKKAITIEIPPKTLYDDKFSECKIYTSDHYIEDKIFLYYSIMQTFFEVIEDVFKRTGTWNFFKTTSFTDRYVFGTFRNSIHCEPNNGAVAPIHGIFIHLLAHFTISSRP